MATGSVAPFTPAGTVAVAASSAASTSAALPGVNDAVLVTNASPVLAFVAFGAGAATATAADTPVLPGQALLLGTGRLVNAAAVLLSGTSQIETVYFTIGGGTQR